MKTVLVTGCAGFIGSSLVDRLLADECKVVGVDNFNDYYSPDRKRKNIELASNNDNFTLKETCVSEYKCTDDVDCVVHLAASAGVRPSFAYPQQYSYNNITETISLLESVKNNRVPVIFASSSSVYGNHQQVPFTETMNTEPISIYGATKVAGEDLCRSYHCAYGVPITCLRFFTCYGPRQRPDLAINKFVRKVIDGKPIPVYGDGSTSRDYTYIDDIIDGIVKAIQYVAEECKFTTINLGSGKPIKLNRLIELILFEMDQVGHNREYQKLPDGDVNRTFADISLARDLLGWEPTTTIQTGIKNFTDWVKNNE